MTLNARMAFGLVMTVSFVKIFWKTRSLRKNLMKLEPLHKGMIRIIVRMSAAIARLAILALVSPLILIWLLIGIAEGDLIGYFKTMTEMIFG